MKKTDLIVISSYPEKGLVHGKKTVGVASYTKNTLLSISKTVKKTLRITVLAEKLKGQPSRYQEGNVRIVRCWQRESPAVFWQILKEIGKTNGQKVLFEFEMAMFGRPAKNAFLLLFLLILKMMGKKVYFVAHQVVLDFGQVSGQLGEKENSFKTKFLSLASKIFLTSIVLASTKVIVFEEFLKERLLSLVKTNKVVVVPHGVERKKGKTKRKTDKEFVLMIFGYIAWYKGTDWLVKTIADYLKNCANKKIRLIVAGGPNPNHQDKPFYKEQIEAIFNLAKQFPQNIEITGYIEEKDIGKYYQMADLVIFPYRTGMSSSGPLSFAFSNEKPFLISQPLAELFKTSDIKEILKKNGIKKNDFVFSLNKKSFLNKVFRVRKRKSLQEKLAKVGSEVARVRDWSNIGKMYYRVLFGNQ